MKQLQNNYTTPEQSKRLLELGVPADSADCVRVVRTDMVFFMQNGKVTKDYLSLYKSARGEEAEPAWSVGRLIEIFAKCKMYGYENRTVPLQLYADEINGGLVEFLIDIYFNYNDLDFSKLEE